MNLLDYKTRRKEDRGGKVKLSIFYGLVVGFVLLSITAFRTRQRPEVIGPSNPLYYPTRIHGPNMSCMALMPTRLGVEMGALDAAISCVEHDNKTETPSEPFGGFESLLVD